VDIKSIIAYSTISQIGYMLLAAIIVPSSSIFHIVVHAFFKSLLFLLAAEIIHNSQAKFQSIYTFQINNSLLRAYFLCTGNALIFSASKEGILHSSITIMDSSFLFLLAILGAFCTTFYTFLLLFEIFSFIFFPESFLQTSYSLISLFVISGYPTFTLFIFTDAIFLLSSPLHAY
jgi:NADH-quinone oxidoreductase subunit L